MDHQDHDIDIPPYASPRQQSRGFDPEMRRIAVIAGGFAVVIVGVALLWGGVHPRLGPVPVIRPPSGPMRTAPKNPGGLQIPGANERIMSGTTASGPPRLAPPPPPPDFSKLAREAASASPPSAPPPATTPATPPLPAPPAPPPAAASASPPMPLPPAANPQSSAPPASSPQSAGSISIQLAALTSKPKADAAWRALLARAPTLLSGRTPDIVTGTVDGRTYYRLRLGGFTTAAAAADFCAKLRTRHVSCYIPK